MQKKPTFGQKKPTFDQKRPTFGQKKPTFGQKRPTYVERGLYIWKATYTCDKKPMGWLQLVGSLKD